MKNCGPQKGALLEQDMTPYWISAVPEQWHQRQGGTYFCLIVPSDWRHSSPESRLSDMQFNHKFTYTRNRFSKSPWRRISLCFEMSSVSMYTACQHWGAVAGYHSGPTGTSDRVSARERPPTWADESYLNIQTEFCCNVHPQLLTSLSFHTMTSVCEADNVFKKQNIPSNDKWRFQSNVSHSNEKFRTL